MIPLYILILVGFSIITGVIANSCVFYFGCCKDDFVYQNYSDSDIEPFYFPS